ncbi:MAG: sugar phosphate nucleotidyltransferase [Candidatus Omnitrophota bacterium]
MEDRKEKKISGVILAAGRGARIKPLSLSIPKPLLPVCNKPIMQYQIEEMARIGIKDIIIVVGHLKDRIKNYFKDGSALGVNISYVEQKETLGIAHAVGQLESYIKNPFLLWLGDIFFVSRNIDMMLKIYSQRRACAVLAVKKEKDAVLVKRNFAVLLHESGMVKRVVEKPSYFHTDLKGAGIYLFDLDIFDAIRRTPRTAMRDEYEITSSIQILVEDGFPIYPADVIEWDMNITYASDLLFCNQSQLKICGKNMIIGENSKVHKDSRVKSSVVGKNVTIKYPVNIVNSLVMDGVRWDSKKDIEDCIVTKGSVIKSGRAIKDEEQI